MRNLLFVLVFLGAFGGDDAIAGPPLKPVPSTYDDVHQFVVGDANMTANDAAQVAGSIDFIWGGDAYTSIWDQSSGVPHASIVGHYIGVNSLGSEDFARLSTDQRLSSAGLCMQAGRLPQCPRGLSLHRHIAAAYPGIDLRAGRALPTMHNRCRVRHHLYRYWPQRDRNRATCGRLQQWPMLHVEPAEAHRGI
jgi:hypothetical protein